MAIHNRRDMILLGIIICGVKSIHIIRKWFGISIFYYIKRYILIKGIILSGTHCTCIIIIYKVIIIIIIILYLKRN